MFAKKNKDDAQDDAEVEKKPRVSRAKKKKGNEALSLKLTGMYTALGLAAVILIAGIGVFFVQISQINEDRELQVRVGAEGLAGRLVDLSARYNGVLNRVARSKTLATRVATNDKKVLAREALRIERIFPDALRVRILSPEMRQPDNSTTPHLSYASIDLVQLAVKSKQAPPAEIHQFGTDQQHIAVARRIVDPASKEVVGVIHIAFPFSVLQQAVDGVKEYGGHVEVRQSVRVSQPLAVAGNGDFRKPDDEPTGAIKIPGTIWQVAYWAEPLGLSHAGSFAIFWAVVFGVALLTAGIIFFQFSKVSERLREDAGNIVGIMDEMSQGNYSAPSEPSLLELADTMELVREICQGVIRDGGVSKKQGAAAQANPEEGLLLAEDIYVEEQEVSDNQPRKKRASSAEGKTLPAEIFRTYDIRGVVGESLTPEVVYELGRAIGSEAFDRGEQTLVVARDGRLSGPDLLESLIEGLTDTGRDVIDLGQVPTPLMYFATHFLNANSGVMLTGSHNPANYNGLKIVLRGETLSGEAIQDLRNRVANGEIYSGDGTATEQDLRSDYVSRVNEDVHVSRPLKVVIDCGNGVAGAIAPTLFRSLGCEVSELFCEVDGRFPNHHPDPSKPENLQSLILAVESEEADIGLAFDGDGDRLGVVDSKGKIIWPDRLLIALAEDVLMRQPGADIIYDVKCTRHLASEILKSGGRPIMWKTGHSLIKSKMRETGALLAGEMSGHIFFKERWYGFDDALYAAARLLEILSNDGRSSAEMFAEIPDSCVTPELTLSMKEGENIELMHKLLAHASLPESKVIDIDGLRAEFEEGWGLVRASNTTPSLVFRFEADSGEELEKVKDVFRHLIEEVQPGLKLPF